MVGESVSLGMCRRPGRPGHEVGRTYTLHRGHVTSVKATQFP